MTACGPAAAAGKVIDLPLADGASQRLLYIAPPHPLAALILFTGGDGKLKIGQDGRIERPANFLIRSRDLWVAQGMAVAIPDLPSNASELSRMRLTPSYADAVGRMVAYLRSEVPVPIWLVGTSAGTIAVVNAASRMIHGEIAGIVLTSAATRQGDRPESVEYVRAANLAAINVPALILSHAQDHCVVTPPGDDPELKAALTASPRVEIVLVEGGSPAQSQPCEALSPHGYYGIESQVVARIADWIKGRQPLTN